MPFAERQKLSTAVIPGQRSGSSTISEEQDHLAAMTYLTDLLFKYTEVQVFPGESLLHGKEKQILGMGWKKA